MIASLSQMMIKTDRTSCSNIPGHLVKTLYVVFCTFIHPFILYKSFNKIFQIKTPDFVFFKTLDPDTYIEYRLYVLVESNGSFVSANNVKIEIIEKLLICLVLSGNLNVGNKQTSLKCNN